jgi:hypothetical protein
LGRSRPSLYLTDRTDRRAEDFPSVGPPGSRVASLPARHRGLPLVGPAFLAALLIPRALWSRGPGGFGRPDSPGAVVRTEWTERELWLRKPFPVDEPIGRSAFLRVHHDEDIVVFLNGERIETLPFYTFDYVDIPLDDSVLDLLRPGENVLAAYCRKVAFGQYCDLGLYDHVPPESSP